MRKYCCNPEKEGYVTFSWEIGTYPFTNEAKVNWWKYLNDEVNNGNITTFESANDLLPHIVKQNPGHVRGLIEHAVLLKINLAWHLERETNNPFKEKVWQHWLARYLCEKPREDRKVIQVLDDVGMSGKSRFIEEYLIAHPNDAQDITPGKLADMAEALDVTKMKVLFIDITRTKNEFVSYVYDFVENLKSGKMFSPKYGSEMKRFPPPHVVIFSNDSSVDLGGKPNGKRKWDPESNEYVSEVTVRPFTYDRYMWWVLTKYHNALWEPDVKWYETCPPFRGLTFLGMMQPYVPHFNDPERPATFGSEFSSDVTGDGPSTDGTPWGGIRTEGKSPAFSWDGQWPAAAWRRRQGTSSYWCMKTGKFVQGDNGETVKIYWKFTSDGDWFYSHGHPARLLDEIRAKGGKRSPRLKSYVVEEDTSTWEAFFPPDWEAKILGAGGFHD